MILVSESRKTHDKYTVNSGENNYSLSIFLFLILFLGIGHCACMLRWLMLAMLGGRIVFSADQRQKINSQIETSMHDSTA